MCIFDRYPVVVYAAVVFSVLLPNQTCSRSGPAIYIALVEM